MPVLAIETATEQLGVALVDEHRVLSSYEVSGTPPPHAVELPQAVARVLQTAGSSLERVEGLVVDIGPGSFTGLRIGVAFVKALVFQSRKPLVGISSLDVLAAQVPFVTHQICPLLDAKRKKVYTALYTVLEGRLRKQSDYQLVSVEELLSRLKGPVVFLGDGVALYRDQCLQGVGEGALFAAPETWVPRAATLGRLGLERLRRGERDDAASLVPLYLYPFDSSVQKPSP